MGDWPIVRFGDLVQKMNGKIGLDERTGKLCVRGGDLPTIFPPEVKNNVVEDDYLGPAFHRTFEAGDVLFATRFPDKNKVGCPNFAGICANTTLVLRANESELSQRILPWIMKSKDFVDYCILNTRGSTNPYINWTQLANYEFALPPLEKQTKIVQYFDLLCEVIQNYKVTINDIKDFRKTYLINIFNQLDNYLEVEKLGDLKLGRMKSPKYTKGINPRPYLRVGNIDENKLDLSRIEMMDFTDEEMDKYRLIHDDILITDGDQVSIWSVGRAAIFRGEIANCAYQNHLIRLRTNESFLSEFAVLTLEYARYKGEIAKMAHMTTIATLSVGRLSKVKVPVTNLKTQQKIVSEFSLLDEAYTDCQQNLASLVGLMSRMFDFSLWVKK